MTDGEPRGAPARSLLVGHAVAGLVAADAQAVLTWHHPPPLSLLGWVLVLGATSWAFATVARALTLGRVSPVVTSVAGALAMALFVACDTLHFRLQGRHLGLMELRLVYQSLRTGVLRPTRGDLLPLGLLALAAALAFSAMFHTLARPWWQGLARRSRAHRLLAALPELVLALVVLSLVLRDLLFRVDDERAAPLFWNAPALAVRAEMRNPDHPPLGLGSGVLDAEVDALRRLAHAPPTVQAQTTPRLLFVHVESLRHDMWNAVNMPRTFAWEGRCTSLPRHYSTGNQTSTGMFGVVTGLNGGFQPAMLGEGLPNLPLTVLGQLGYARHVWFPNETLALGDLGGKLFGHGAVAHAVEGDPTYLADGEIVARYLADVDATTGKAPRFDYLVLDSSHYDYAYPPELEVNRPVSTLGVDFDRRTGQGTSRHLDAPLDEETRRGVFNRYKNSVLFADTQVDRLLSGLADRRELERTLVVVFGDHGEAFWEHDDTFGHHSALDEPQTHVPLLFCGAPRLTTRYRYSSHADVFPTVFALMGLESSAPFMSGKSLASYDPSLDFALIRSAVLDTIADPRFQLVADGLKLGFYEAPVPLLWRVTSERDEPWPDAPVPRVERAMAATVLASVLR